MTPWKKGSPTDDRIKGHNNHNNHNNHNVVNNHNYPDSDPDPQRDSATHPAMLAVPMAPRTMTIYLTTLLQKHDQLAEGFENRDANSKSTGTAVSATTTKKNGIASTSASASANANANASAEGDNVKYSSGGLQ